MDQIASALNAVHAAITPWDPWVPVRAAIYSLADSAGLSADQLLYTTAILFGFPAAFCLRFIPTSLPTIRNLYVVLVGASLSWYTFQMQSLIGVFVAMVGYILLCSMAGKHPIKFFAIIIGLGLIGHLVKMKTNYGNFLLDFQSPLLIIVIKVSYLGWNLYDGTPARVKSRSSAQATFAIDKAPSLLQYLSHIFFFGNFFAGPVVEFQEYRRFIHGEEVFSTQPSFLENLKECGRALCKSFANLGLLLAVYNKYFSWYSCMCCGAPTGSQACIDASAEKSCAPHQLADWFIALPVALRVAWVVLAVGVGRSAFYFVWYLDEAICNLSGLGYQGEGKPWNRCRHGDWFGVEFSQNMRGTLQSWNAGANTWLRRCVYERSQQEAKFGMAMGQLLTMVVSGIWHGIYPGHILTFVSGFFLLDLASKSRQAFRPLFQNKDVHAQIEALESEIKSSTNAASKQNLRAKVKQLDTPASMPLWYNILCVVFTAVFLQSVAFPFHTLDYGDTLAVYKGTEYFGIWASVVGHIVCRVVLFFTKPRKAEKKKA